MLASIYVALIISVLFSRDCSSSSAEALGQLEESNMPHNGFSQKMMVAVGDLQEKGRSSGLYKDGQLPHPPQVSPKVFNTLDLGFKIGSKTVQQPFKFQRFFKPSLGFRSVKEPLDFFTKRTETSQVSNQGEHEMAEVPRELHIEENRAVFPMGKRNFDVLRCMLGRVYRPCW